MSSQGPEGGADKPNFAEENAMRVASEQLSRYDQEADVYHCSYGPPAPAAAIHDEERGLLVRVDPETRQVLGFSIPEFKAWYADHAEEDGTFEVDLPSVWGVEESDDPDGEDAPE